MNFWKTVGNVIWFIFTGLFAGISFFLTGVLWCITIIGIPFGLQCFKLAKLMFTPFGKVVTGNFTCHPIANVIWAILFGWEMMLGFFIAGAIYCITIIGIPFGKQCFKLAALAIFPFGVDVK